jgi:AcrR family transcriptional regulator
MTPAPQAGGLSARERILEAAREVFALHGSVGATTRRIAEAAGVNEVTLFRHFGSKEALLEEAARTHVTGEHALPLPDIPSRPQQELTAWCAREISRLRGSREFILQCFSEAARPELATSGAAPMAQAAEELTRYVERMHRAKLIGHPEERATATSMLLASLYADAFARPVLPGVLPEPASAAPGRYVAIFLRALGAPSPEATSDKSR